MAFPTIRSSTSGALTTAGLSLTVTLPSGHSAGDLLIIGVSLDGSRAMSAPSGWTLLANPTNTSSNRHAVWYKTRGATESNPTISWSVTSELGTWYSIAITTGTWSGTPEIATAYSSSSTPNAPTLTPSWGLADTLWLTLHGWDYNRTSATSPSGFTLLTYQAGSSTVSAGHRTHYRQEAIATKDPTNITISATDTWYAHTVAVQPYVAPAPAVYSNIGGVWKEPVSIHVNIGGVWKDVLEFHSYIGGVWREVMYLGSSSPTNWAPIALSTPNGTQTYYHSSSCPSTGVIDDWLTANYPPEDYSFGYIMRVTVYNSSFGLCGNYDFEAE